MLLCMSVCLPVCVLCNDVLACIYMCIMLFYITVECVNVNDRVRLSHTFTENTKINFAVHKRLQGLCAY